MHKIVSYLLFGLAFISPGSTQSCLDCEAIKNCIKCTTKTIDDITSYNLSLSSCKNSSTLSWMCCKSGCSSIKTCDGSISGNKCDGLTYLEYLVDDDSDSLFLQIHDGKINGNINCSGGGCCGGSGTSCSGISGVCEVEVSLSSCISEDSVDDNGGVLPSKCLQDADCRFEVRAGECSKPICESGECIEYIQPSSYQCRQSQGVCDNAEYCNGIDNFCPNDAVKSQGALCRETDGECDVPEYCDGVSKECPSDIVQDSAEICREAEGACDVAERCDGVLKTCPIDVVKSEKNVCREAEGACDVAEFCDGTTKICPADIVKTSDRVCRNAIGKCDIVEYCDGSKKTCPEDIFYTSGYTMKCGRSCYVCAAPITVVQYIKRTYYSDVCNIGACDKVDALPWPECQNKCIGNKCVNDKDLSNYSVLKCNVNEWQCTEKTDVTTSTIFPICK